MLHYCTAEQAKNADNNLYIQVAKNSSEGYGALSPYTVCDGVRIPGMDGESAPSAFAALNACKVIGDDRNLDAVNHPQMEHAGDGSIPLLDTYGAITGLDRTHETYLYKDRYLNFIQARWAILIPAYEQYLWTYCQPLLVDLHETVAQIAPGKVCLYDHNGTTFDLKDPTLPVSGAWLATEVYNRVFSHRLDALGEVDGT